MATIITRAGKGSPLTNNEVDNNFTNLNSDKLESGDTVASLTITSADINGGTIDGVTIGGASAGAATFTSATVNGNITVTGTVDGRDVATDGTKLDGIEAGADVTDTTNVTAAGALMDSELTNITAVKALNQGVATTDSPSFSGLTATTADINGGTIDGVTIGGASAGAGAFSSLAATTADINGGTIDGTVIGGSTPAAISGTTGSFSGNLTVDTNTLFVDATNNRVGIGTTSPAANLDVNGSIQASGRAFFAGSQNVGTMLTATGSLGGAEFYSSGVSDAAFMSFHRPGAYASYFGIDTDNTFAVGGWSAGAGLAGFKCGALSKASGSFKIDHPLKPDTHYLVHSFIEGPQADNIYRGRVTLVDGSAVVDIDAVAGMTEGTFVALNRDIQCFTSNETGWCNVRGSVAGNILTIEAQDNTCTDTISWLVIGERHDQHMYDTNWTDENAKVIVEPEKTSTANTPE